MDKLSFKGTSLGQAQKILNVKACPYSFPNMINKVRKSPAAAWLAYF